MAKYLDSVGLEHLWGELKQILGKKADVSSVVSTVIYDSLSKKFTKTIGDSISDITTIAQLKHDFQLTKADVGLENADNTADAQKNVASAVNAQALISDIARPVSANEMHSNTQRLKTFLATSAMTAGKPPSDAHILHFNWETGEAGTGTRDSQMAITSGANPGVYFRTQNSGVWTDWIQMYSTVNLPSYTDVGLDKVRNLTQKALHGGSALIRRANLNNVTDIGNYYAISDALATTLVNSPTKKAFHMYVGLATGEVSGYEYQEVIEAETGSRYYRMRKGSEEAGWTDWATITEYTAGAGLGLENSAFYTKVFPATEATTKRLTALGTSKYILEEYAADAEDLPTGHGYIVMTATGANVRYGVQLAMNKNADKLYYRRVYNSVYGEWLPLIYKAGSGLSLEDGTFSNSGVISVAEGTENGTIKVSMNGTVESVPVHGLGDRAYDSTIYIPATGGTITGTISAVRSGQIGFEAENTNANNRHKVSMIVGSGGNAGLYDNTYEKWIAYSDKNGNVLLNGKASSAIEFADSKSIALSGDVTGTASSKAGWSIYTTLANTAVGAGRYGPTAGGDLEFGGTLNVPYFQVDAKGRLIDAATRTYTLPELADSGVIAGNYGPSSGSNLSFGGSFTVPFVQVDAKGRITNASNKTFVLPTLSSTGVTVGSYGPTSGGGLSFGGTFNVPYFQVDANGRLTNAATRTFTLPSLATTGVTAGTYGPTSNKTLNHSDSFVVPYYKVDDYGRITNSVNRTLTLPSFNDTGVDPGAYGQSSDASPSHGGTIRIPYFTVNAKGQITKASTKTITLPEDKNTVYTAGDGLSLRDGEFRNTGVRTLELSTGSANGTIAYSINSGTSINVFVKGLDSAAYRSDSYFALAGHTHSYAGSDSVGGAANSVANDLVIRFKSGTSEGSTQYTFNGSRSKTLDIKEGDNITLTTSSGSVTIKAKDTTYSAGTGITLSNGNAFSLTSGVISPATVGPIGDVTGNDGNTVTVPRIRVDTYGRVTLLEGHTYTSKDTHYTSYLRAGRSTDTTNYQTSNGETYLNLIENGAIRSGVKLNGDTDVLITSNGAGAVNVKTKAVRVTSRTSVDSSAWTGTSNSDISGVFPYQAFVTVSGADASQYPDVTFRPKDIEDWELSSTCQSSAGGVYIYAKKKPTSTIYILGMRFF